MKNKAAFTLIEILVVVGVLTVLVVSVGGIMGSTFKAKNSSEGKELLSAKAAYVLTELKRNVLNAKSSNINQFTCPVNVGASIAFITKDNLTTTLECKSAQIASKSATNGNFNFLDLGLTASDCSNFVECIVLNEKVSSVKFNLNLKASDDAAGAGTSGFYYGVATPRE